MNDMKQPFNEEARLLSRAFGGRVESQKMSDGTYTHTAKAFKILSDTLMREIISLHKWHGHSFPNIMECQECAASEWTARMIQALKDAGQLIEPPE